MSQKRRSRRSEHKWGQLRIVNSVLLIFLLMTASWATYTMSVSYTHLTLPTKA